MAPRQRRFRPDREPLQDLPDLELAHSHVRGPFPFLDPTTALFRRAGGATANSEKKQHLHGADAGKEQVATDEADDDGLRHFGFQWSSRNNRKGRHTLVIPGPPAASASASSQGSHKPLATPQPSTHPSHITKSILRMLTYYPVWDVSYLVAVVFTLGSVIWVINAFFVFLPLLDPATAFEGESLYGGGITAFVGATVFEIGSVLLMLEAVNEKRSGCFGWAVQRLFYDERDDGYGEGKSGVSRHGIAPALCVHHHTNKRSLVGSPPSTTSSLSSPDEKLPQDDCETSSGGWTWWPSTHDLRTHFLHQTGFLACLAQMFGATIFWISGFTALPGIYNVMSPGLTDGIYWTPQVVGGCGFIASGMLFMLETQSAWWRPALSTLGWHIGFWNLIGGIGFTLCPAFGFDSADWAQFQASCSTFWASWAFLIGSVLQWYESLDKFPVKEERDAL